MVTREIWVAGRPATFATKGEKSWKEALLAMVPRPGSSGAARGVRIEFVLTTLTPNGMPLDVDNLCEPLFSAVVNGLGWFNGQRTRIEWWDASKRAADRGEEPGCWVRFDDAADPGEPELACSIDAGYVGSLPRSARDQSVHAWAWEQRKAAHPETVPHRATLWLDFADSALNLGDIATGRVKNFIDCLFPLIGGSAGSPDDHRFERIVVTRNSARTPNADVRVRIEARGLDASPLMPRPEAPGGQPDRRQVAGEVPGERGAAGRQAARSHNPLTPGTGKWVVLEAAIRRWPLERVRRELEALGPGRSARIREYLSDVRRENGIPIFLEGDFIVERPAD